ncbi:hypothetical protein CSOJ01_05237 [Colletotrichum sojae]|uniref:Zn(2)-C6 fungal-type domain-containing protein n=1 Tax=Colletotrichum sojae TaxID=2175907 RepID=A0A8H6JFZ6_9PEZI|nr:hypothetical protein CSOJ01_05237 [Colletotrichum sojae]
MSVCESRFVKCDEHQPTCLRCQEADIRCYGYTQESAENAESAEQRKFLKLMEVCQEEMQKFGVNIQRFNNQYGVLEETVMLNTSIEAKIRTMEEIIVENEHVKGLEDLKGKELTDERNDWRDWDAQSDASTWSDDSISIGAQSGSTQSSFLHIATYTFREKLRSLIMEDADITKIYMAGLGEKSVGSEDMTRALRSRLHKLGKVLGQSSSSKQQVCAKVIRRNARDIAEAVRRKHDFEYRKMQPYRNKTAMEQEKNQYIIRRMDESCGSTTKASKFDLDSVSSGDDEDTRDTEAIVQRWLEEVEEFIWNHPSMAWMKGSLASFVVDRYTSRNSLQNLSRKSSMPELIDRWFGWIPRLKRPPIPPRAKRVSWKCMLVDFSDYASVNKHSNSCTSETSSACQCWPPQDLIGTEYTCAAGTSPGTSPAVGPNYLLHYFEHPEHLRPGQKLLIRYVHLKMGSRLAAGEDEMKAG